MLLVGEAPGYYGCRQTGIPFTSGTIIKEAKHGLFQEIGKEVVLFEELSENTATIFWNCICNFSAIPVIWNTFPFHPHQKGLPEKNRKPNALEIKEGKEYIKMIYEIFRPKILCAVGKTAEKVLKELYPSDDIIYIRHPSHGGKMKFIEGIQCILKQT
jgi:uracil-DNA glycosylase